MNRRNYLKVSLGLLFSGIIAGCRKDVGKIPVIRELRITSTLPVKAFSGDVLKIFWISENIEFISVYIRSGNNEWNLKASGIDAENNEFAILLPSIFLNSETLSIKITGDDIESVKSGIITQNAFIIDTSEHPELINIGGVKNLNINSNDVFVKRESTTDIKCFSSACTHAGCPVSFLQSSNKFNCSCHGSQFDTNGNVLQGPASSPLNTFVCETLSSEKFRILY